MRFLFARFMSAVPTKARVKRRVALACKILYQEGLREETGNEAAGHISVRLQGSNTVIMPGHLHHLGSGLKDITVRDIIELNLDGKKLAGSREPVEEYYIHTFVYKARPEVNSVVHAHLPAATALGSTDSTILPISIRSSYFAAGVPVLERGPGIIDNEEIAEEMVKIMGDRNALIHKGHGVIVAGRSLEEACILTLFLEGSAKNQLVAKQLGNLRPFDTGRVIEYANSRSLDSRKDIWRYFENKWKRLRV